MRAIKANRVSVVQHLTEMVEEREKGREGRGGYHDLTVLSREGKSMEEVLEEPEHSEVKAVMWKYLPASMRKRSIT